MPSDGRERSSKRKNAGSTDAQVVEEGGQPVLSTDEEDAQYIMVTLEEELKPEEMVPGQSYKLTGLDTETPQLELGNGSCWTGRYENLLGTTLFFDLAQGGQQLDKGASGATRDGTTTRYAGQTELCIKFRRSKNPAEGNQQLQHDQRQEQSERQALDDAQEENSPIPHGNKDLCALEDQLPLGISDAVTQTM